MDRTHYFRNIIAGILRMILLNARFQILTTVLIKIQAFWNAKPSWLAKSCWNFVGSWCFQKVTFELLYLEDEGRVDW
jgi:hypothetical protein